jgi:hypothetical protein
MGYTWEGMSKITKSEALERFQSGKEVFILYEDDTEAVVEKEEEITCGDHGDYEFGYHKDKFLRIRFTRAIGIAQKESEWELMMEADGQDEGNLFCRLGKKGEKLSVSPKNTISLLDADMGRFIMNGTVIVEYFSELLKDAIRQYPECSIDARFEKGAVWIRVDDEHLFGYRQPFAILDAHGDEGAEYYGGPEELKFRVGELFSQADQSMVISSFILG